MATAHINPYVEKIMGEWSRNILTLVLAIGLITLAALGIGLRWIDKDFGLQIFYLLFGINVGEWLDQRKK